MELVQLEPKEQIYVIEYGNDLVVEVKARAYRLIGSHYCFYEVSDKTVSATLRKGEHLTPVYEVEKKLVEAVYRKDCVVGGA